MSKSITEPWTPKEMRELGDLLMERNEQVAAVALSFAAALITELQRERDELKREVAEQNVFIASYRKTLERIADEEAPGH